VLPEGDVGGLADLSEVGGDPMGRTGPWVQYRFKHAQKCDSSAGRFVKSFAEEACQS